VHDPADDPTIIDPIHTANVGRQMRLDPSPLLIAQPKQIPAHDPDPSESESGSYGIRIALLRHQN
jgi:hypothetical protein